MADIAKLLNAFKNLNDEQAIEKLSKAVKSGEAGISSSEAINLSKQLMPFLDKKQQALVQKLITKLR